MTSSTANRTSWRDWLPVCSLAFGAFIFVTTELMPIGLLTELATDLGQTESFTGLLVTWYAWCVALASLPLTILTQRFDRRTLMVALFGVFIVAHLLAAFAPDFITLMVARISIALTHAIFWSITTPLAFRLAPKGYQARALAIVITGTSLAAVLGVPIGKVMGYYFGWRLSFGGIGVVALVVLAVLASYLPPCPSANVNNLQSLPALLKKRVLVLLFGLIVLLVTAHFTAFSYLSPFFLHIAGLSAERAAFLLFVLGGAGILGSFISSKVADRYPKKAILCGTALLVLSLALLLPMAHSAVALTLLCVLWGAALPGTSLVMQTVILKIAQQSGDAASSIYSSMFNVGIGGGAFCGSYVLALFGVSYVGFAGAVFAAAALCVVFALRFEKTSSASFTR